MKHLALIAFACLALVLSACQSTDSGGMDGAKDMAAGTTVNTICPMNPKDEVDPAVTRDFMGTKVGFCCEHCTEKWDTMTDDAKKAALEKIGVALPK